MRKTLLFVRLDFITVRPYITLKNFAIFFGVALIMLISSGTSTAAIAMLMVYAALYVSYPFAVSEQNGIDALYATLALGRGTVVLGRYLFTLALDLSAGLLAYGFSFAVSAVMGKSFDALESLIVMLTMLLVFSLVQAFQLPVFFKHGYAKAKLLAYLPFAALTLVGLAASNFLKESVSIKRIVEFLAWFAEKPFLTASGVFVVWLGICFISCQSARAFYGKRDF